MLADVDLGHFIKVVHHQSLEGASKIGPRVSSLSRIQFFFARPPLGAIVNFYVGAASREEALMRAVQVLRHMGMVFVDLVDGKVIQLDHEKWWDEYVMVNFPEHYAFYPSQDQIHSIVNEGLVCHGPFAGWDRE